MLHIPIEPKRAGIKSFALNCSGGGQIALKMVLGRPGVEVTIPLFRDRQGRVYRYSQDIGAARVGNGLIAS